MENHTEAATMLAGHRKRNPNLKGVEWTDAEVHRLVELWKRHVPFRKIARRMGRSKKSVVIKASRLGMTERPYWNDEYVRNARRLGRARPCMSCRRLFFSEWIGHRVCDDCKDGPLWSTGNDCAGGG